MSYTHCHTCGKILWWDDVEYEEIDGEIYCFNCVGECEVCGNLFGGDADQLTCDNCTKL